MSRRAFTDMEAAHAAASARKTVEMQPGGRGAPVGWAVCDAPGGGFFARLGFQRGPSIEVWPQRHPATFYQGRRAPGEAGPAEVLVNDPEADQPEPLDPRHDLRNHSPDGFQWGYGGSGPAQLALALLCDALGDDKAAVRLYQRFKFGVIAQLGRDEWTMTASGIRALAAQYGVVDG